jgi:hypothetical protein
MIYYLMLPVVSLLLLTIQITVFDIVFLGKIAPEISVALIIYAGFYLGTARGGALSLVLGFFMDSMVGVVPGFFIFTYLFIFLIGEGRFIQDIRGGMIFAVCFTLACVLLEKSLILLVYKTLYGVNVLYDILPVSLIQAAVTGALAPIFFALFRRLEGVLSVWESRVSSQL